MIQLTALRDSSSAIQPRASDPQTRLLTNSDEPSSTSLPPADDHTAVDGDDISDEIDSLLNKFDLGERPLSRYWQVTRSPGRS